MDRKTLQKTITRDVPVVAVESYYEGIVKKTTKFYDIEFSENLYLFKDGTTQIWRENESFFEDNPEHLSEWVKSNEDKLEDAYNYLNHAIEVAEYIEESAEDFDEDKSMEQLKRMKKAFAEGLIGLISTFWFPIWDNKYREDKDERLFDASLIERMENQRSETEEFFDASLEAAYTILSHISDMKGWDVGLLKYITWDELQEAIENDELTNKKELKKRKNNPFAYFQDEIIWEDNMEERLRESGFVMEEVSTENVGDKLQGTVACEGEVEGQAKLVLSRQDLEKVNEGDILIAPMTTPWYLPAMKKAGAIVTDEGGITSHAAITSRELDTPCVIGTEVATQVLEDGDEVEVDASEGVVNIID